MEKSDGNEQAEELIKCMLGENDDRIFELVEVDGVVYKVEIEKYESANTFLEKMNAALKKSKRH